MRDGDEPPGSDRVERAVAKEHVGWDDRSRKSVSEVQRGRILAAMAEVVAEHSYGRMTVGHVIARARVSRKTFYDLFENREACFLATLEHAVAQMSERVLPAWSGEQRWVERVRASLFALLVLFDEQPRLARLCVVEAMAAGPRVLAYRAGLLGELTRGVDAGRGERQGRRGPPPPFAAEGAVGAAGALLHTRLVQDGDLPLTDLYGPLLGMILLPYLGAAAAAKQASRPAVRVGALESQRRGRLSGDLLRHYDMRVTYRTLRVLAAIAASPGASNREIAASAAVIDQGQISRLLRRLASLELIENTGEGQARGAPNAWWLTPKGEELQSTFAMARQSSSS
jgi:AcrR family transcriptional regulator